MSKLIEAMDRFKKDYVDPPELKTREQVEKNYVYNALKDAGFLTSGMKRLHLDSKYWACSKKEFQDWIRWDWTNKKKYVAEEYDCDNFAFSFKARCDRKIGINTVGLVIDYSGGHAYNVVAFTDSPAKLYEPQSDRWVEPNASKSRNEVYKLTNGYIIL